jgi:hypothetical protein
MSATSSFSLRNTFGTDATTTRDLLSLFHTWIRIPNAVNAAAANAAVAALSPRYSLSGPA